MVTRISSSEARDRFADLVASSHYGGQITIIERSGKPMAAVIPIEMYKRLMAERETRFNVLDNIRAHFPNVPPDQVEKDIAEAIAAVRASGAAGRP